MKGYHTYSHLNQKEARGYREYLDILKGNVVDELTRLDLFSIRGFDPNKLSDYQYIEDILYIETRIKKNEKESNEQLLRRINSVFQASLSVMSKDFFLKIPDTAEYHKDFSSVREFIFFMCETSDINRQGYLRLVDCAVLKTMAAYNQILDNPAIPALQDYIEKTVERIRKIPGLKVISESKRGDIEFVYNSPDNSKPTFVKGKISYRIKAMTKTLMKMIYNREYINFDQITDLLGFQVEIEDNNEKAAENAISLFNRKIFGNQALLSNKGLVSEDFIREFGIDRIRGKIKSSTASDFRNASLVGQVVFSKEPTCKKHLPKDVAIEVQFVYVGNNNENGYRKHEIYDAKKLMSIYTRLFGYLTREDILLIIQEMASLSGLPEDGIIRNFFSSPKKLKEEKKVDTIVSSILKSGNGVTMAEKDVVLNRLELEKKVDIIVSPEDTLQKKTPEEKLPFLMRLSAPGSNKPIYTTSELWSRGDMRNIFLHAYNLEYRPMSDGDIEDFINKRNKLNTDKDANESIGIKKIVKCTDKKLVHKEGGKKQKKRSTRHFR